MATQPYEMLSHYVVMTGTLAGPNERRLLNDLMANYNKLERPVANESEAVVLKFGLTLQQIMDVVSCNQNFILVFCCEKILRKVLNTYGNCLEVG